MGISMGKKGGLSSEPNIVPLIDILLVLIIIFMVVTPLTPNGLPALAPQPNPNKDESSPENLRTIVVQLTCASALCEQSRVKINQEESDWDRLGARLVEIYKTRAEKVAFVKADDDLEFGHVARAIDIIKGAGVDKIGLMTPQLEAGN